MAGKPFYILPSSGPWRTYLIDYLLQNHVSIVCSITFDCCHDQITHPVHCVWELIKKVKAAWQHGICESVEFILLQWISILELLQTFSLFLFLLFPSFPFLLLLPASNFLEAGKEESEKTLKMFLPYHMNILYLLLKQVIHSLECGNEYEGSHTG